MAPKAEGGGSQGPLADTEYHRVSARVLAIANKLRVLGVDSALQVPTLVIAGDQSSGKSSVVEAIAGVALPRSDGTCTRCPTEVRMRTDFLTSELPDPSTSSSSNGAAATAAASRWSCRIRLCRDYDSDGVPLLEKPPEELFCTVTDKAHIAACVTAAQAVLLNPRAVEGAAGGARAFVPELASGARPKEAPALRALGDAARYELGFTANKVVLEIDGAEADLTIIDLPGIIHDHPKGRHLVDLVERMTKQNLAPAHHIIAMALPAGLDPETQAIRLWAREVDADGHRSIGIITKPDMIAEEAHITHGKLIRLVGGRTSSLAASLADDGHLRLGYYVVKNPAQEQLEEGITFKQAREAELRYFAAHNHWALAIAASPALAQRLGANHLRAGLSCLLVERVEAQMPAMRRSAREQLAALAAELAAMPLPPSEDAMQELRGLLRSVAERMDQHVFANSPSDKAFYQKVAKVYATYGESAIRSTPAFLVGHKLISALSHEDKGMIAAAAADGGNALMEGELDLSALPGCTPLATEAAAAKALAEDEAVQAHLKKSLFPNRHMTLDQVRALRQRHLGRELPCFSPYSAVEELIRAFKGQWSEHALACLEDVAAAAHEQAGEVVAELFGRYPKALRAVGSAVSSYVEELTEEAAQHIRGLAAMEDLDVFTLNSHYLRGQFGTFLGRLKRAYLNPRALVAAEEHDLMSLLGELAGYGLKFTSYDDAFMAQPTPVDDELSMMAACLAYFKVAFKRIQDEVPIHIRNILLRHLADRRRLEEAVLRHLHLLQAPGGGGGGGGGGDVPSGVVGQPQTELVEAARGLLAEDESLAARRVQRRDMERRLREALAVLSSPAAGM